MRFPRLTNFAHEALAALHLDVTKPAADSISAKLWAACDDVAQDSLNSDFMQGLGNGTLSPDKYGQYIVQDCAYCANAAGDYRTFEGRATAAGEPKLAAFAKARYESYEKFMPRTCLPGTLEMRTPWC
jgi:thiaminase/transcriptional activator TenA